MGTVFHATLEEARRLLGRLERMSVDSSWARRASGTRGGLIKLIEEIETAAKIEGTAQARLDVTVERAYELLIRAARELRGRNRGPEAHTPAAMPPVPFERSYWVEPGQLLAGCYPGDKEPAAAQEKVRSLVAGGVTVFLDLTEEGELKPYAHLLKTCDPTGRARHIRRPVKDLGVPAHADLRFTLDILERALALGECVYVHCWGGIGRTGTVVGAYLVRQGLSGDAALAHISRLRTRMPENDRARSSPETPEQADLVRAWARLDAPPGGAAE